MERNWITLILCLLLVSNGVKAAIPLNSFQTFDTAPTVADWATRSEAGTAAFIVFPADLDLAAQTNDVSTFTNSLRATTSGTTFGLAQWHSDGGYILTRPAGVAYQAVLATVRNTSGKGLSSMAVIYDFGNPAPNPGAEDPGLNGLRAYYSLIGQPGTWSLIPEFSTGETGTLAAVIAPGFWAPDALLYLMWADDNGTPAVDSAFTIDNFIALESLPPPPPPSIQPPGTNVLEGRTIQLTLVGGGFGLSFQWLKDGVPIEPLVNPTARQRTLVITNATFPDSGQYAVMISNAAGGVLSNPVTVRVDNPHAFRLLVDSILCTNASVCLGDATWPLNWGIYPVNRPEELQFPAVTLSGTTLEFTVENERAPGQRYVIELLDPSGAPEIHGTYFWTSTSITSAPAVLFQQGLSSYASTQDTELHSQAEADTVLGAALAITADLDNSGIAQGLLRFGNLVGSGSGRIPFGARILFARLSLTQVDAGSLVTMHRMLVDWDQSTATWNTFIDGVSADGVEARGGVDAYVLSGTAASLDVTSSVQAWVNGQPNFGWLLQAYGTDGFAFASSESASPPELTVIFEGHGDPCTPVIVQQPSSLTVPEGGSFTLFVGIDLAFCSPLFQWIRNGVEIPGATNGPTYSISSATLCDAGTYRLRIIDPSLTVTSFSSSATVTIPADIVRPVLTRAVSSLDGTNITLTFSKVMGATSAADTSHYVLDPPVTVVGAALSPDGRTVTLTTPPRTPLTPYTLRIGNVTDNRVGCPGSAHNLILPDPTIVPLTGVRVDVPWDSEWLYSTNNQDATLATPTPWYALNFSPGAGWFAGQALLGTETSAGTVAQFPTPLRTPIPPNTNSPPDQITTYFRKQIELPPLPPDATYALCHFIDDGAVFYLDGVEIGRVGMIGPPPILFAQHASTAGEASLLCFPFSAAPGPHTLAVEVHQGGAITSSDILFGVQIEAVASTPTLTAQPTSPPLSWSADSSWELVSSTNAAGPYVPVAVNPSLRLGSYHSFPTNPASFFRLRYKGAVK